ncbi:MAG: hypothetical protein EOP60_10460 [Sphingomonadales bacterium]|nr:MAG: hypothetical protein EOP60_10460 [Sphingomonadales bacterium]
MHAITGWYRSLASAKSFQIPKTPITLPRDWGRFMSSVDGRVLIFAGAGASKAVHPHNYPTTKEFFERLPESITENPLFQFCLDYLMVTLETETIDIEQMLWALQELQSFYSSPLIQKSVVGYAFKRKLAGRISPNGDVASFANVATQINDRLIELIGQINQIVYEFYSYEPEEIELDSNWLEIINKFYRVGTKLDIFTTNYDVAIEAALNILDGDATARKWRGIKGSVRQILDLGHWLDSDDSTGRLTKLHGSLDWKIRGESIYVGDPVFTGDHTKQAIIYPGFKGESPVPFFQIFHEYLAQSLSESKVLIFVGFAFRDDYINRLLRSNIKRNAKVYIINPDRSISFPAARNDIKYITDYFDIASIEKVFDDL